MDDAPEMMWLILATAAVAGVLFTLRRPSASRLAVRAISSRDLEPVVELVSQEPDATRPTAFDQATRTLWDAYERTLAAKFIYKAADAVPSATILQYWIKQLLDVEPDIAAAELDDTFLSRLYHPELAAKCGKKG